jgi:hypothetical protein
MRKEIRYNPATRKFDLLLDDEVVGEAWNYADGDRTLDELEAEIARLANDEPAPMPLALAA